MIAMGVVRGWPLLRPRIVISPLNPRGVPAANSGREIGLNTVTHHGARSGCFGRGAPGICWVIWILLRDPWLWVHTGTPPAGPDVTAARRERVSRRGPGRP